MPSPQKNCKMQKVLAPMKNRQNQHRYGLFSRSNQPCMKPSTVRRLPSARRLATNRIRYEGPMQKNKSTK